MEEIKKYKYLLHGHFDNNISRMIDNTRKYMLKKYKKYKYNGEFNYGYPHITIIYGPVIKSKNEIEINKKVINKFYPGFLNNFNKLPNDIKYIGITPFFALDRVIIKAEFESKQLNKIRKYLIDCNPEIKQYYNEFKISKKNIEKDLKKKYPNIYIKDKSYNKIPKGWIHVTILVLKDNVSEDIIKNIISTAEKYFLLKKDDVLSLDEIGINLKNKFTNLETFI